MWFQHDGAHFYISPEHWFETNTPFTIAAKHAWEPDNSGYDEFYLLEYNAM
jgi:hypothetical protein